MSSAVASDDAHTTQVQFGIHCIKLNHLKFINFILSFLQRKFVQKLIRFGLILLEYKMIPAEAPEFIRQLNRT